jgi:hypothetical protein
MVTVLILIGVAIWTGATILMDARMRRARRPFLEELGAWFRRLR